MEHMAYPHDLAAKALAATGGKSTLTATEWILGQMESRNSSMPKPQAQQVQGRVDQFFATSSVRRVASSFVYQQQQQQYQQQQLQAEEESNVHWRTRPSSSVAPDELDRKRFVGKQAQQQQDEELSLSMFRKAQGKPRPPDVNEAVGTSHSRPSLVEPSSKRLKQSEPEQEEAPVVYSKLTAKKSLAPLAERIRPGSVDLVVGQDHLLGPRCILRSLIDNNALSSIIFWGPPGTGKTSLVRAISRAVSYRFIALSAVSSGLKEVREILEEAKRVRNFGERTLLFLDEIHRFNKTQQDAFLPYVEAGYIVFIGATTENPSFEINAALLSRCRVLTLNKLQPEHIRALLDRAIADKEKGLLGSLVGSAPGDMIKVEEDALQFLASAADGDARAALNSLEIAGLAAFAAWEEKKDEGAKQEVAAPSSLMLVPASSSLKVDISGTGFGMKRLEGLKESLKKESSPNTTSGSVFGMKRLEVLKESLKKENSLNATGDDYTKPFKRFVGGKEVVKGVKEVRELSLSGGSQGDSGGYNMPDVASKEVMERMGDNEASGSGRNIVVTLQQVQEAIQRSHVLYDKTGEEHYNIISALHKSMRGGDPDAAIYWLARMLEGGEGPLYVARRLIRFASEDVGLADPQALVLAVACYQACHFIGMPECNVNLAQCVTYLALAPKSVMVYHAIEAAQRLVKGTKQNEPVPMHLRNAPTQLMKEMGYGRQPEQQPPDFLPPSLRGHKFLNGLRRIQGPDS